MMFYFKEIEIVLKGNFFFISLIFRPRIRVVNLRAMFLP